jgi:hypothetical protein
VLDFTPLLWAIRLLEAVQREGHQREALVQSRGQLSAERRYVAWGISLRLPLPLFVLSTRGLV